MDRTTELSLRGVDASADSSVVFRFSAGGQSYSWRFTAATLDELVALGLDGRLGEGKDVHFDSARVSFQEGGDGKPDTVTVAIGRKVRIVAPIPRGQSRPSPAPRSARRKTAGTAARRDG